MLLHNFPYIFLVVWASLSTMFITKKDGKATLKDVILSVASALLGVQSKRNADKDFSQPSVVPYIIVGIIATILFVLTLLFVVHWVTANYR